MTHGTSRFKQDISLVDVISLGISASVGVSIFSVFGPAAALAGPALLIALALSLMPMLVFLVVYAFLGSAVPASGSSYVWPAKFVHPYAGFIVSWLRLLTFAGIARLMGTVFCDYLVQVATVPISRTWVMIALFTAFFFINLIGVGVAGKAARVLVGLKMLVIAGFIVIGIPNMQPDNFRPFSPFGTLGILSSIPLLVGLFGGIESSAEVGEEIRNSRSTMGRGMAASVFISFIVYVGIAAVTVGVLGAPGVAASPAPLADAGRHLIGTTAVLVVVAVALVSIAGAFNALMLITSRFVFAMGRDGIFPGIAGHIHPRFGTPHIALAITYAIALLSLLLPSDLIFLFLAVNIPTILKYCFNCIAAIRLVDRHPELHASARLKLSAAAVRRWAWAGVACSLLILVMGISADLDAYLTLVACTLVGSAYWWLRVRHRRSQSPDARRDAFSESLE